MEILRGKEKACVHGGCVTRVVLCESRLGVGRVKGAVAVRPTSTTHDAKSCVHLARPLSPFQSAGGQRERDNPADESSRSKRYRPGMHGDVDQCGTFAPWSAADSELFAVLSQEGRARCL